MKGLNRFIVVYYIVLLLALMLRQGDAPPLLLRIAFLFAVVLPPIVNRKISYPAIIIMFTTLTFYGFTYSYMPYTLSLYVLITLVLTIFFKAKDKQKPKLPLFLIFFPLYMFIIDLITGISQSKATLFEESFYCFVMLLCFTSIAVSDEDTSLNQLPLSFMVISIILALYFLLNRETFAVNYDYFGEYERSGWGDPNYFGTVLGMGVVIAFSRLFDRTNGKKNNLEAILSLATIVLTVPVMLLNASRGAVLSVVVAGVVLFMFIKAKKWQKLLVVVVAVLALIYLNNNQYMDLLVYRIESDETGGSGRSSIWSSKLTAFVEGNVLNILFGYGYTGGLNVSGRFIGFHNDFIAFLVDYGIVGFIMFIYMISYPLIHVKRSSGSFPFVLSIIVYLVVTCLTLEPLTAGRLPYFSFYLIALLLTIAPSQDWTDTLTEEKDIMKP